MVNGDALPRLGGEENRVSDIALSFAAPRNLCHGPIETASAARGADPSKECGDLAIESHCPEAGKREMTKAVMPPHQLRLIIGSGNTILVFLGEGWQRIIAEVIANNGRKGGTVLDGLKGEHERLFALSPSEVGINLKLKFSLATNSAGSGVEPWSSQQRPGCWRTCSLKKNSASRAWKVCTKAR